MQVENEHQVLESEIDRLNTEIQLKGSLIKELEMKVSRLEVSLSRPHEQLRDAFKIKKNRNKGHCPILA